MKSKQNLIVTGAGGRIGRLIRLSVGTENFTDFSIRFTSRHSEDPALRWDMTGTDLPDLPKGGILLHLAAALPGRGAATGLSDNMAMAQAVLRADQTASFTHVVFMSTVAVYAPQSVAISETVPAAPQNDYGRTKWQAEQILRAGLGDRLTVLRLANLAGADALLGAAARGPVLLDPVPGQAGGPLRSYIGPMTLARTLAVLLAKPDRLPAILNLAQPGVVAMADLLDVSGRDWGFGPYRPEVLPKLEVDVTRMMSFCPLPIATAGTLWDEVSAMQGLWP